MNTNSHLLKQLVEYRQELANEEESLKEIRTIIQKQINALDIEKLHLESVAKKPVAKDAASINDNETNENDDDDDEPKQLDLNVPSNIINDEEEEEDDEEL